MNPEERISVIHEYLMVKILVLFIRAVRRILRPERMDIIYRNWTLYNLQLVLCRSLKHFFSSTVVLFLILVLGLLMDLLDDLISVFLIGRVDLLVLFRSIGLYEIDLSRHE